jgi:hypothetical protein
VFWSTEKGEHDLVIIDYAVEMASTANILEKDHRTSIKPPRLTIGHFDSDCTSHDDYKLPRRGRMPAASHRLWRRSDQSKAFDGHRACGPHVRKTQCRRHHSLGQIKVCEVGRSLFIGPDMRNDHKPDTPIVTPPDLIMPSSAPVANSRRSQRWACKPSPASPRSRPVCSGTGRQQCGHDVRFGHAAW